jgi:hypothetical protein
VFNLIITVYLAIWCKSNNYWGRKIDSSNFKEAACLAACVDVEMLVFISGVSENEVTVTGNLACI